ncbi:hypothetical protein NDU88_000878 [Pleurodeles waltl]|uniref:Uncharacterized protein n=1 Tax=Pleurodeles waltl TaxID=8319 RepID=A0AAV7Q472_PLEWA|nr:hypothetical protein NDU88_000878 [Pleurodeles waltl]
MSMNPGRALSPGKVRGGHQAERTLEKKVATLSSVGHLAQSTLSPDPSLPWFRSGCRTGRPECALFPSWLRLCSAVVLGAPGETVQRWCWKWDNPSGRGMNTVAFRHGAMQVESGCSIAPEVGRGFSATLILNLESLMSGDGPVIVVLFLLKAPRSIFVAVCQAGRVGLYQKLMSAVPSASKGL